jgi:hypothetical protein
MTLPKFVLLDREYILHTVEPRIYAQVLRFKNEQEFTISVASFQGTAHSTVGNYMIHLVYAGSLGKISVHPDTTAQINLIFEGMTIYYMDLISKEPIKYKKYKL